MAQAEIAWPRATEGRGPGDPGGSAMATFLMLSTVGPDGAETLRENPDRLKAVNAEVAQMGVRVVAQWALLGPYDFCTVLEADDERAVARVAVELGARGTLKTVTLAAIPIDEFVASVRGEAP